MEIWIYRTSHKTFTNMTINKTKLPLFGNSVVLSALFVFLMICAVSCSNNSSNDSSNNSSSSANEANGYGEFTKKIEVEDVEISGGLGEYLSVVPGSYELIYISKKSDTNYGQQEFIMKVKFKLEKTYPNYIDGTNILNSLNLLNKHGVETRLALDMGKGLLDSSEEEKLAEFMKSEPGSVKEFMFYESMGNREMAEEYYKESVGFNLWLYKE